MTVTLVDDVADDAVFEVCNSASFCLLRFPLFLSLLFCFCCVARCLYSLVHEQLQGLEIQACSFDSKDKGGLLRLEESGRRTTKGEKKC